MQTKLESKFITLLIDHSDGLVRRALLRTSCLGLIFRKEAARATSKRFRRVTSASVNITYLYFDDKFVCCYNQSL